MAKQRTMSPSAGPAEGGRSNMRKLVIALVGSSLLMPGCGGKDRERDLERVTLIAVNVLKNIGRFRERKARDQYGSREFKQKWSPFQWKRQARKFAARFGKVKQWERIGGAFEGNTGQFRFRVKWEHGAGMLEIEFSKEDGQWKMADLMLIDKTGEMVLAVPGTETQPESLTTRASTQPVGLPDKWSGKK